MQSSIIYRSISNILFITATLFIATATFAKDDPLDIVLNHIHGNKMASGLSDADLSDRVVRDRYVTKHNGMTHLYLRQRQGGIEVYNGDIAAHVAADGRIIALHDRFVRDLAKRVNTAKPVLSALQAVESAAKHLGLSVSEALSEEAVIGGPSRKVVLSRGGVSEDSIPVKLMYYEDFEQGVRLVWNLVLHLKDGQHWWDMNVDATTGEVLSKANWVANDTYRVYALPKESPNDGARTLVVDPYIPVATNASPYGWHDTNGVAGAEFTDTRGNNVFAQEDQDHNNTGGARPNGGAGLNFDISFDPSQDPTNSSYQSAAIVNLFYWNNICHDIHYQYGFDEASGNFQENNYARGGLGGDPVQADAQDGTMMNNANMSAPPDGTDPRMQMFLFNVTSPRRDGDLDASIIIHEYGHGVSIRLTGGPGNSSCLDGVQNGGMGEGWSDWWALVFTAKTNDTRTTARGLGTYVLGQPSSGQGIRSYRYSTDMAVNPLTFGWLPTYYEVHDAGEIWCVTLWEMYWNLVDAYGFDPDLYHGTGGNNIAMRLVMDGLKLQPCNPTMLNARDAIVQADQVNYGGAHRRLIWEAFAKRGMGLGAYDGGSPNSIGVIESFEVPDDLIVSPQTDFIPTAAATGGPFTPSSKDYMLINSGTNSINWTATRTASWLDLSASSGSLAVGTTNTLTVSLNANATTLPTGRYSDTITISNTLTHAKNTRRVTLMIDEDDFTELFSYSRTNDLDYTTLLFTPDGSHKYYRLCSAPADGFPVDPNGGTSLPLVDDDFTAVTLTNGAKVVFYGTTNDTFYIGSNGYITFGSGDTSRSGSFVAHFSRPRISALYLDLDPGDSGDVSWKQLSDRAVVTFVAVPEYGLWNSHSFQVELFFDGRIRMTFLKMATKEGLTGLSRGAGMPAVFTPSDLSAYPQCGGTSVIITEPAYNSLVVPPTNLAISASASTDSGVITKVEFFEDGNLISSDTTSPYHIDWNNPPVGEHLLTAVAYDSNGQISTSGVIPIVVYQYLTWLGTTDTNWDTTTANWTDDATVYSDGAQVAFDTIDYSPATTNVTIRPEGVRPLATIIDNTSTKPFVFNGGNLGGNGPFLKDSAGTITFSGYTGNLTFGGGAIIYSGTVVFQSGTNGIPLATRTQSFGTGVITLRSGYIGDTTGPRFRFQGAAAVNGYTNILNNAFRIINGGTIQFGAALSTKPKIIFSGPITFCYDAALNLGVNGIGSTGVDTNGYEFTGTMTLNGNNEIRRTGSSGSLALSLSGNIIDGGSRGTLILSNAATSAGANRQLKIRGTNNTYSGGTVIRNDAQATDLSTFFGSVEVAPDSRLGTGNVTVDGGAFLRLLGNNNIATNATLAIKVDPSLASDQQTGIVWIAAGVTNRIKALTLGPNTYTAGVFSSNNVPGCLYGGGVILLPNDLPTVTVTAPDASAAEWGADPGGFQIARTGSTNDALVVTVNVGGTAANGVDYLPALVSPITIPAGSLSTNIVITPVADTEAEGNETASLAILPSLFYATGSASNAVVVIADRPMDQWKRDQFGTNANNPSIAGDLADPDNDGINNLMEYALNMEPLTAGTVGLPVAGRDGNYLTLTYRKWRSDLTYTVEVTGSVTGGWTNGGVTEVDDGSGNTKATDPETISGNIVRFIRLKVTRP